MANMGSTWGQRVLNPPAGWPLLERLLLVPRHLVHNRTHITSPCTCSRRRRHLPRHVHPGTVSCCQRGQRTASCPASRASRSTEATCHLNLSPPVPLATSSSAMLAAEYARYALPKGKIPSMRHVQAFTVLLHDRLLLQRHCPDLQMPPSGYHTERPASLTPAREMSCPRCYRRLKRPAESFASAATAAYAAPAAHRRCCAPAPASVLHPPELCLALLLILSHSRIWIGMQGRRASPTPAQAAGLSPGSTCGKGCSNG